MKPNNLWYLFDEETKKERNALGVDYTPAYIPALLARIGTCAAPIAKAELPLLGERDVLLIGAEAIDALPSAVGGVILLGGSEQDDVPLPHRDPTVQGYLIDEKERKLPLFAPIFGSEPQGDVLAWALTDDGRVPALVRETGRVYRFRFDLCASVWFSGEGFEKAVLPSEFLIGRTPGFSPFAPGTEASEPYNDRLLALLEGILHRFGILTVYPLPPTAGGGVPDFLFHVSGDDDHTSSDYNLTAARVMHDLGIPYHINLMPQNRHFVTDRAQMLEMEQLGCEVAIHTDFTAEPYSLDGQKRSCEAFSDFLGRATLTNTNHCLIQRGPTAERVRWLSACGLLADNSMFGEVDLRDINAFDLCGFSFGSSFPTFTCDDAAHGNAMLSALLIPINYYEPRIGEGYGDGTMIERYLDAAAENGRIAQFFIHPHYLARDDRQTEMAIAALRHAKAHWEKKGYRPLLTTTDRIARFWQERAKTKVRAEGDTLTVHCTTPILLRLPYEVDTAYVDQTQTAVIRKTADGKTASLLALPAGKHTVTF